MSAKVCGKQGHPECVHLCKPFNKLFSRKADLSTHLPSVSLIVGWLFSSNSHLSVPRTTHASLVHICRPYNDVLVVHNHQLGVDIDGVAEGVSHQLSPGGRGRVLEVTQHGL